MDSLDALASSDGLNGPNVVSHVIHIGRSTRKLARGGGAIKPRRLVQSEQSGRGWVELKLV